jgi:hypothetical protein
MYRINLPREFVNPPLFLLRHESKPKRMAKRLGLALRPTLRQDLEIAEPRARKKKPVCSGPRVIVVKVPGAPAAPPRPGKPTMTAEQVMRQYERTPGGGLRPKWSIDIAKKAKPKVGMGTTTPPPIPKGAAMPKGPIRVKPATDQGARKLFKYAPEGGFMQSTWRTGVAALRVRPTGTIKFRPHPVGQAKPR